MRGEAHLVVELHDRAHALAVHRRAVRVLVRSFVLGFRFVLRLRLRCVHGRSGRRRLIHKKALGTSSQRQEERQYAPEAAEAAAAQPPPRAPTAALLPRTRPLQAVAVVAAAAVRRIRRARRGASQLEARAAAGAGAHHQRAISPNQPRKHTGAYSSSSSSG